MPEQRSLKPNEVHAAAAFRCFPARVAQVMQPSVCWSVGPLQAEQASCVLWYSRQQSVESKESSSAAAPPYLRERSGRRGLPHTAQVAVTGGSGRVIAQLPDMRLERSHFSVKRGHVVRVTPCRHLLRV
jgi:hypothetical protein